VPVEQALEVIAVTRLLLQQAKEGVGNAHVAAL
jgi:hypothetical protein